MCLEYLKEIFKTLCKLNISDIGWEADKLLPLLCIWSSFRIVLTVLVVVGRTQDYVDVEDSLLEGGDEKRAALEKRIYPNYLKSTFSSNKFPIFDILCVKCKMFKQERFISLHQWVKLRMKKTTQIFSKNLMKFKYDMCVPL